MRKFKRARRLIVAAVMGIAVLCGSVSALAIQAPVSASLVPNVPEVPLVAPSIGNAGHLVSAVYRNQYVGSTIIGCLEDGTRLTVLKTYTNFYKIDCYDMTGYIHKSQVAVTENGEYVVKCDPDSQQSKYLPSYAPQAAVAMKTQLLNIADDYIGVRYVWGGTSPSGFDCSGYVQYIMNKAGITVNRSALMQLQDGVIIAKEDLQCGDLVYFSNTGSRGGIASHVAMYIGNNQIIHSGTSTGVVISDLNSTYYAEHYMCARRIVISDVAVTAGLANVGILQESGASQWRNGSSGALGLIG